jgi:general secretion pathway protein D
LARERTASKYEEQGRTYLKERQIELAVEAFKRALTLEPMNRAHQEGLTEGLRLKEAGHRVREAEKLAQLGRREDAFQAYTHAAELDPSSDKASEGIARLSEQEEAEKRDDPLAQPVTLKFKGAGLKEVLESLAKIGGMNIVFDKDVRNDPVSIAIEATPFDEALELILNSNSLFSRRVGPQMLLISPNTKQKQEQYQDLMIRTFYLSHTKAKDMLALLRTMLDTKRLHANEQINTIVIRDTPEKVELAERIITANDRDEPEVIFDVEVLEVNRTKAEKYGLTFPKQAGMAIVPPGFTGTIAGDLAQQFTYRQLTSLGQDSFLFKLPTNIVLDFFKSVTDAKTLASPKLRVVNNRKGEVNIGDKQPILLSTTNVLPGQATTGAVPTTSTVTSVEFRDTGVKLTVEPSIRLSHDLSLKMKIEVIRIGDRVLLQASPPIEQFRFGNRSAETTLSMKDGETIVLAGLIQEEDRKVRVTVPWLGDLPVIGNWFSSFQTERVTTEVILTITPRILDPSNAPGLHNQMFWSGTDSIYTTKPIFSSAARKTSLRMDLPDGPARSAVPLEEGVRPSGPSPSSGTATQESARSGIKVKDVTARVGEDVRVSLLGQDVKAGASESVKILFDPDILTLRLIQESQVFKNRGGSVLLDDSSPGEAGMVAVKVSPPPKSGMAAGEVALLTFAAKAAGVSSVHVEWPSVGAAERVAIVRVR